jgi:cytochrome c
MRGVFLGAALAAAALAQDGQKLIQASDCSSCHAVDRQVVGPAYSDIAKRHAGQDDAVDKLSAKIRDGGGGMTPHPDLSDAQRTDIARWILLQKDSAAKPEPDQPLELFVDGKPPKVTKSVFHGYQLYNSYCYRCHGTDATGGQLAPDLRHSLVAGMKQVQFLSVAMTGRKEQGMPSWAGFLNEQDVIDVYKYVKGRSLDLVPSGRPASEQD